MRDLINLILEASKPQSDNVLKKTIIDLIKTTDEGSVLNQVLKVLKAGNIDQRITNIIGSDADAKIFLKQITDAIIQSDASIEQKNEFLEKFPKGILDVKKLTDGKPHTIEELVGPGFPSELFKDLSTRLTSQGVGPGEVALAVFSPKVKWSGRAEGGGDILVNGKPIEVKTRVSSGGRWLNARKAKMDLQKIKQTVEAATGMEVPDRLNVKAWVDTYRPAIQDKKTLDKVTKIIADSIFNSTDNSAYQKALKSGDAADITDEHLRTGYNNYKKLSGFEGVLLMDLPTETSQYFKDYDSMEGKIKSDATYLYGPESEMMPKVSLTSGVEGAKARKLAAAGDTGDIEAAPKKGKGTSLLSKAADIVSGRKSDVVTKRGKPEAPVDIGRTKRKR